MKLNHSWIQVGLVAALALTPGAIHAKGKSGASKISIPLLSEGGDDGTTGSADFKSSKGKSRFKLKIKNGPPDGEIEIFIGGVTRGTVTCNSSGSATVQFQSGSASGKNRLLDFDPRGQAVEVKQGDTLFLSVTMPN